MASPIVLRTKPSARIWGLLAFFASLLTSAAQTNAPLSDAEVQGQQLAQSVGEAWAAGSSTNIGTIKIRDGHRKTVQLALTVLTQVETNQWETLYQATTTNGLVTFLTIHHLDTPNTYFYQTNSAEASGVTPTNVPADLMVPFANSDFWLVDLGLDFFHWPGQKILKKEVRRSRGCTVLESTNPSSNAQSYSRVVSWIDGETHGIVHAEAYDFQNHLLKEFDPKSFDKVHGQWELHEMEIDNVQTGSRTRLEFDNGR